MPDGTALQSSKCVQLNLPNVPPQACKAHVLPGLAHASLLSLGVLCDNGCTATFDNKKVTINHQNKIVLTGNRDPITRLWHIPLSPTSQINKTALSVTSLTQCANMEQIIHFYHATLFSPVASTLVQAVKNGYLSTWPGLTSANIKQYLKPTMAMAKGHLDQVRCNQSSNHHNEVITNNITESEQNTHAAFATIQPMQRIYTDQTGRFPYMSSRGHQYIMILYSYDSNAILSAPLKNKTEDEILKTYIKFYNYLTNAGFQPNTHWLDNEASTKLKEFNKKHGVQYQLTPPNIHRRNASERAIRTWKNHFIVGLESLNPDFPMHLWDRLIQQATDTLNMLRPNRSNTKMSAYNDLEGMFNYEKTPLAPPGTKVLVHEKSLQQGTWAPHGKQGWYIGGAPEHYRCYTTYVTNTRSERITDTLQFFHHHPMPLKISSLDQAIEASKQLTAAIADPSINSPLDNSNDTRIQAIKTLANIFGVTVKQFNTKDVKINHASLPRVKNPVPNIQTAGDSALPRVPNPVSNIQTAGDSTLPRVPQHRYPTKARQQALADKRHSANAIIHPVTGQQMQYKQLITTPETERTWTHSFTNELGRLAQGADNDGSGTNTIQFINHNQIPLNRRDNITYGNIIVDYKPHKEEPHQTRLTVGGDRIRYPGHVTTPTADITTIKLLLNSTISTPGARLVTVDIHNFYLDTHMERPEFMFLHKNIIPETIYRKYSLQNIEKNNKIYIQINKGMYGLPQAGKLAHQQLITNLHTHGYFPCQFTPGLWRHRWRPVSFTLVVDNFAIKYVGQNHAQHLIDALKSHYSSVAVDWSGDVYCGMSLDWNYQEKYVDISMPGYIHRALNKFQHSKPVKPQHSPYQYIIPNYKIHPQIASLPDEAPHVSAEQTNQVQQIIGTLLFMHVWWTVLY